MMSMNRIRKKVEKLELESYTDVIHDSATEDWTYPYDTAAAAKEREDTSTASNDFLRKVTGYIEDLLSFYELTATSQPPTDFRDNDIYALSPHLEQYILCISQPSKLLQWGCECANEDAITWAEWLRDYINGRAWSDSRTSIIELIRVCNEES